MGLTINYMLRPAGNPSSDELYSLVRASHQRAAQFVRRRKLTRISPVRPVDPGAFGTRESVREQTKNGSYYHDVAPLRGWIFEVFPGRDCESLTFALCRYPASIFVDGRRVRTHCGGWSFHGFCKTQYASLHGEAHFLHCHRAVIDLLRVWQRLGLDVEISDEGDYWPGRNRNALLARVRRMNAAVAALAGAVKDATNEASAPVQAPIFAHPAFEHLEAEGAARHSSQIATAIDAINTRGDAESAKN